MSRPGRPSWSCRDAGPGQFHRHRAVQARLSDTGEIEMEISSDDPIDMGGWREVLSHAAGAVDTSTCTALLVNHDINQIAGPVRNVRLADGRGRCSAAIAESARLASGMTVREAVQCQALRGVSIGYTYDHRRDCDIDEDQRLVTVRRWRLLEVSLTPTPADPSAGVRTFPTRSTTLFPESPMKMTIAQLRSLITLFAALAVQITERAEQGQTHDEVKAWAEAETQRARAAVQPPAPVPAPIAPAADPITAARAEAQAIARLARSVGLPADDYVGQPLPAAQAAMLQAVAQRSAAQAPATGPQPSGDGTGIRVVADAGDKLRVATRNTLHAMARLPLSDSERAESSRLHVGIAPVSIPHLIRSVALAEGHDAASWSDLDLAAFASRLIDLRSHGRRDAANNVSAQFSTLLANASNRAIQAGLNGYNYATWNLWCTQRMVSNFKAVTNAGLQAGMLTKTGENLALPELTLKDGGYNSTLGLYGATISLTFQALVNDELGQFMDTLRRIGAIAAQTIDRQAYYALLTATWTNDTGAAPLSTLSNLDIPRQGLMAKLGPAGQKLGIKARYVLHDPKYAVPVQQATGAIYGPGQTTAPSNASRQIIPVESHWIADTTLLAGALYTDYYLAGDPNLVDTVLVNFLQGLGMSPMVMPFDAGAVVSEKWKVFIPFEATVATHTDSAANARISGIQKATAS